MKDITVMVYVGSITVSWNDPKTSLRKTVDLTRGDARERELRTLLTTVIEEAS